VAMQELNEAGYYGVVRKATERLTADLRGNKIGEIADFRIENGELHIDIKVCERADYDTKKAVTKLSRDELSNIVSRYVLSSIEFYIKHFSKADRLDLSAPLTDKTLVVMSPGNGVGESGGPGAYWQGVQEYAKVNGCTQIRMMTHQAQDHFNYRVMPTALTKHQKNHGMTLELLIKEHQSHTNYVSKSAIAAYEKSPMYMGRIDYPLKGITAHGTTDEKFAAARIAANEDAAITSYKKPIITMVAAGMDERTCKQQAERMIKMLECYPNATLLVSDSMRTNATAFDSFMQEVSSYVASRGAAIAMPEPYRFKENDATNPYLKYLAAADVCVLIGESTSMAGEMAFTGKKVFIDYTSGAEVYATIANMRLGDKRFVDLQAVDKVASQPANYPPINTTRFFAYRTWLKEQSPELVEEVLISRSRKYAQVLNLGRIMEPSYPAPKPLVVEKPTLGDIRQELHDAVPLDFLVKLRGGKIGWSSVAYSLVHSR
jgi:Mitochondrial fission ELM1